ncbi:MAG: hypothetical protein RBQ65_03875 [Sphaerochaeta sp.]|nr:hypothetical protein [Sphaerochaeta sp.]
MRRVVVVIFLIPLLCTPLFGSSSLPKSGMEPVTVQMVGVIQPRDVEIVITNEAGVELGAGDGLMVFEFPALEQWEVTQSLNFSYSSHLASNKRGYLSFQFDEFGSSSIDSLRVSLELKSNDQYNTHVENGNTFNTLFVAGYQDTTPMGTLTVRIQKRINDIYTAGLYSGVISMTYTEES